MAIAELPSWLVASIQLYIWSNVDQALIRAVDIKVVGWNRVIAPGSF